MTTSFFGKEIGESLFPFYEAQRCSCKRVDGTIRISLSRPAEDLSGTPLSFFTARHKTVHTTCTCSVLFSACPTILRDFMVVYECRTDILTLTAFLFWICCRMRPNTTSGCTVYRSTTDIAAKAGSYMLPSSSHREGRSSRANGSHLVIFF